MIRNMDELLDEFRRNVRIPQIVAAVLAILVLFEVFTVAKLGLHFFRAYMKSKLPPPEFVRTPPTHIGDWHLMGVYNLGLGDLPETQLQLVLQGTEVSLNQADDSRAIIATPSAPAKSYGLQASVPGGAIIHQILPDRIILNHNGILEELRMKIPKLERSSPPALSLQVSS